jgi:uncharacterized protein YecA (UPF0149 family)
MLDELAPPLSEDEFLRLAEYLEVASSFSIVGLLGFLPAMALAPTPFGPRQWVPRLFPRGEPVGLEQGEVNMFVRLLWRQFEHVAATLVAGKDLAPEPDDMDSCQAFSGGVRRWRGDLPRGNRRCVPPAKRHAVEPCLVGLD